MKILELMTPSNVGGAENYVAGLAGRLAEKGAEVFVMSTVPDNAKSKEMSVAEFLSKKGVGFSPVRIAFKYSPLAIFRLYRFIRKNGIDIVHTHLSRANVAGAIAARLAGAVSVSTAHGLNKKAQYRFCDYVICVSGAVRENLISQGMDASRLKLVYNGIDTEKFSPCAEGLPRRSCPEAGGNADRTFNVGMVGRLSKEKGADIFIDAAAMALGEIKDAKFFIAGTGLLKEELIKKTADSGIFNSVYFLGFVGDNLTSFLNELDVAVFPSLKEGLPLALLEAMSMEKIVVVTDAGGMPEAVEDGVSGFVVPRGRAEAIYKKLIFVYNNYFKDEACAAGISLMGVKARKAVLEKFNMNGWAEEIFNFFTGIMEGKGR